MIEIRPVKGYEGLYMVDNLGNVFRCKPGGLKQLSPFNNTSNGTRYMQVKLYSGGEVKNFCVHKLVAEAFIENPFDLPVVDHLNGDYTDNRACNLEWVTNRENVRRGKTMLGNNRYGSRGRPVIVITELGDELHFPSVSEAARVLCRSRQALMSTCRGRQRTSAGCEVFYEET